MYKFLRNLILQTTLILVVTLALLEAILLLSFQFPAASPVPKQILQQMYVLFVRNTIQLMPECAQYDPELTYILRPGHCTFSNKEFSNDFLVNSLGLRDTEEALLRPETVVLGDSVAMGWGVDQHEAFPQVYESLTGSRTLNAAISSYGTARELLLLDRLDRSLLRHLIIQYHNNDLEENEHFVRGEWRTLSQADYENAIRTNERMLRYHPGKHSLNVMVRIRDALKDRRRDSYGDANGPDADYEASVFLGVLEKSPVPLDDLAITVIALDSEFIRSARRLASRSDVALIRELRFVDAGPIAEIPGAFYILDDHPTAIGHAAMAELLVTAKP